MNTYICPICKTEFTRYGKKPATYCSLTCKAEAQRQSKPVTKEWLQQKYVAENLSTYTIAKIVNRNPKRVYEWLVDFCIPTRPVSQNRLPKTSIGPHANREWLYEQYVNQKRSASSIAEECNVGENNIYYFLSKFNIPRRSMSEIRKIKRWGLSGKANGMFGRTGKSNPNYKTGSSPERQTFYSKGKGKDFLKIILSRDNYTCQRCGNGKKGKKGLHVHHIKGWAIHENLRFEANNCITLCRKCHEWVHSKQNINNEFVE